MSSNNLQNGPTRTLLSSVSIPRDIGNQQTQGRQSIVTKRRGSTGELQTSQLTSPSHIEWCSPPIDCLPPSLTSHQLELSRQATAILNEGLSFLALVGPRGAGKSTIAFNISHQSNSTTTLWLSAQNELTLRASYVALLRQRAPQHQSLEPLTTLQLAELVVQAVLSQLQQPWQIVYNDVQVEPSVFFSKWAVSCTDPGRILLTSSNPTYQTWEQEDYKAIAVESKLTVSDAKAILMKSNRDNPLSLPVEDRVLQTLKSLLQENLLALSVVGMQICFLNMEMPDFSEQLEAQKDDCRDQSLNWFWTFTAKEACKHTDCLNAFQLLAMIHNNCIPGALLKPCERVLPTLEGFGILKRHGPSATFSMSFEIQRAIQKEVGFTSTSSQAVQAIDAYLSFTKLKHTPSLLPHLETLRSHINQLQCLPSGFPREAYANVLLQMGLLFQRPPLTDYKKAKESYSQGLQMLAQAGTEASPIAKSLYFRLGNCAWLEGNHREAKAYSLQALVLHGYAKVERQDSAPKVHHNNNNSKTEWNVLSQLFHICGHASWQDGDVIDARVYFEYELAVKQAWYGGNQPNDRIARTLNNLGSVCRDSGDLMAARDYFDQALKMQSELGEGGNLETATVLSNLGSLYYSLCEFTKARTCLEQALVMKEKCYQQQQCSHGQVLNLDVGETYFGLGTLAEHLGNFEQAEEYYQKSLECKYAVFGRDAKNAHIAACLASMALLAMNHGLYSESEKYYMQALEMQQAYYQNQGNMEVVRTLHGLGILNYHLQRFKQSRQYHREALEMQQKWDNLCKSHHLSDPRIANLSQIMQNLGNLAHNLGDYEEAQEHYCQALKLYSQVSLDAAKDEHFKTDLTTKKGLAALGYFERVLEIKYAIYGTAINSDLAFTLRSLAMLYDNSGRHQQAKDCLNKALTMAHHLYGGKYAVSAEIAAILDGLGTVNFNLGDYGESQRWLQNALAMKKTIYGGANNTDVASSLVSLGILAHTLGNYEEARHNLEKAFAIQESFFGKSGDQNIVLGTTATCLANLYRDLGEADKALALYKQAAQLMGKDDPFVLVNYAEFLRQMGDYGNADLQLQKVVQMHRELYGDAENAEVAASSLYLGKLCTSSGRFHEAAQCLEKALRLCGHGRYGDDVASGEAAAVLQALGDLMLAKGDPQSAKVYLEKATAMRKSYGDVKTVEMAQALHTLGIIHAELQDSEKSQSYFGELKELCSVAPYLSKALDQKLCCNSKMEGSAAPLRAHALSSVDEDRPSNRSDETTDATKPSAPPGSSKEDLGSLDDIDRSRPLGGNRSSEGEPGKRRSPPESASATADAHDTLSKDILKANCTDNDTKCAKDEQEPSKPHSADEDKSKASTKNEQEKGRHTVVGEGAVDKVDEDAQRQTESEKKRERMEGGSSRRQQLKGGRQSSMPRLLGEQPEMDWSDRDVVKRKSMQYGERGPEMDWSDRQVVKRKSTRHAERRPEMDWSDHHMSASQQQLGSNVEARRGGVKRETGNDSIRRRGERREIQEDAMPSLERMKPNTIKEEESTANGHSKKDNRRKIVEAKSKAVTLSVSSEIDPRSKTTSQTKSEPLHASKVKASKSKTSMCTSNHETKEQRKSPFQDGSDSVELSASKKEFAARKAAQKWRKTIAKDKEKATEKPQGGNTRSEKKKNAFVVPDSAKENIVGEAESKARTSKRAHQVSCDGQKPEEASTSTMEEDASRRRNLEVSQREFEARKEASKAATKVKVEGREGNLNESSSGMSDGEAKKQKPAQVLSSDSLNCDSGEDKRTLGGITMSAPMDKTVPVKQEPSNHHQQDFAKQGGGQNPVEKGETATGTLPTRTPDEIADAVTEEVSQDCLATAAANMEQCTRVSQAPAADGEASPIIVGGLSPTYSAEESLVQAPAADDEDNPITPSGTTPIYPAEASLGFETGIEAVSPPLPHDDLATDAREDRHIQTSGEPSKEPSKEEETGLRRSCVVDSPSNQDQRVHCESKCKSKEEKNMKNHGDKSGKLQVDAASGECPRPKATSTGINERKNPASRDRQVASLLKEDPTMRKKTKPQSRRVGSMGCVTDMPPRQKQTEAVTTTCGWWPFRCVHAK